MVNQLCYTLSLSRSVHPYLSCVCSSLGTFLAYGMKYLRKPGVKLGVLKEPIRYAKTESTCYMYISAEFPMQMCRHILDTRKEEGRFGYFVD